MNLRRDLRYLYEWVPPRSRVLDLGCGDGALLATLTYEKDCVGYGVEINSTQVLNAMAKGVNVLSGDIDHGLDFFKDNQFDIVILSQTLQAMQNIETILQEMLRVGKEAVVSFPNFAYWRNRMQLNFTGRMPISESMPYRWYNTPNIHWCTIKDFETLCHDNKIALLKRMVLTKGRPVRFLSNLRGSLAVYRLGRHGS
ncbi:MAG: methionine biosynthesis protein MetW [Haemophilus parainfluenzae]|mgnify:FL=1|jgi:methionine biosynthesis protein metW|nr:MAG: methionine biosynthesis protein MetW [Haemophilus parainfluenzae]